MDLFLSLSKLLFSNLIFSCLLFSIETIAQILDPISNPFLKNMTDSDTIYFYSARDAYGVGCLLL